MERTQLQRLKQLESVQSYAQALQKLCFKIFNLTNGEAYLDFTMGLKQLIQNQIIYMTRQNLDEAIAMAEKLDNVQYLANNHTPKRN